MNADRPLHRRPGRRRRQRGFTLLEVMIALAVASLGLMAVYRSTIQSAANTSALREQTLAHWVAMNQITELRVSGEWPDVGSENGDAEFADTEYRWEYEVSETDVEALRRVDLTVAYAGEPDRVLASVSGFIGRPQQSTAPPRPWQGTTGDGNGPEDGQRDGPAVWEGEQ